jgi:hypothetical protein
MAKAKKLEDLQKKSIIVDEKFDSLDELMKEHKELQKEKKDFEKREKDNHDKIFENIKLLKLNGKPLTKHMLKSIKNTSDDKISKSKKPTKLSGMYRTKAIPENAFSFLKKIISSEQIPEILLNKEYEFEKDDEVISFKLKDLDDGYLISQHAMSQIIGAYMKHNNQYIDDNHKIFKPDSEVRALLQINEDEQLTFEQFQKFIKRIYAPVNIEEDEEDEEDEEEVEETVEEEVVVVAPPKKSGKKVLDVADKKNKNAQLNL